MTLIRDHEVEVEGFVMMMYKIGHNCEASN
jgi:hypothetical protein